MSHDTDKTFKMLKRRSDYHEIVLTYGTESASFALEFIWKYGTEEDREYINKLIDEFKKKGRYITIN